MAPISGRVYLGIILLPGGFAPRTPGTLSRGDPNAPLRSRGSLADARSPSHSQLRSQRGFLPGPDDRRDKIAPLQQIHGHSLHVVHRDALDRVQHFIEREMAAEGHVLAREVRHATRRTLEVQHEAALEVIFRATELAVR